MLWTLSTPNPMPFCSLASLEDCDTMRSMTRSRRLVPFAPPRAATHFGSIPSHHFAFKLRIPISVLIMIHDSFGQSSRTARSTRHHPRSAQVAGVNKRHPVGSSRTGQSAKKKEPGPSGAPQISAPHGSFCGFLGAAGVCVLDGFRLTFFFREKVVGW